MTLRSELEALMLCTDSPHGSESYSLASDMAMAFLRDHGPVLLEAVRDAERYRWLMEHATMEAPFGAVSMKTVPPDNPQHTKTLWDGLIDAARGDA